MARGDEEEREWEEGAFRVAEKGIDETIEAVLAKIKEMDEVTAKWALEYIIRWLRDIRLNPDEIKRLEVLLETHSAKEVLDLDNRLAARLWTLSLEISRSKNDFKNQNEVTQKITFDFIKQINELEESAAKRHKNQPNSFNQPTEFAKLIQTLKKLKEFLKEQISDSATLAQFVSAIDQIEQLALDAYPQHKQTDNPEAKEVARDNTQPNSTE